MASYQLDIITPEGHAFNDTVTSIMAPGEEGFFGIFARHAPLISALKPGVLTVRTETETIFFAVGEGMLEADGENVSLLIEGAERATDASDAAAKALTMVHSRQG